MAEITETVDGGWVTPIPFPSYGGFSWDESGPVDKDLALKIAAICGYGVSEDVDVDVIYMAIRKSTSWAEWRALSRGRFYFSL